MGMEIVNHAALVVIDEYHDVPASDTSDDNQMRDVIGKKDDTVQVTWGAYSLVSYIKGLMGFHGVASVNDGSNARLRDPVGNKADAAVTSVGTTKSIMAYAKGILNTVIAILPYTTTGVIVEDTSTGTPKIVTVTSHTNANTFGGWVEIDASVSADSYICSALLACVELMTATVDADFVIEIGTGASPATKIRTSGSFVAASNAGGINPIVLVFPRPIRVASGTKISVQIADDSATTRDYKISVQYYQNL